jgi:hypothetical protein
MVLVKGFENGMSSHLTAQVGGSLYGHSFDAISLEEVIQAFTSVARLLDPEVTQRRVIWL